MDNEKKVIITDGHDLADNVENLKKSGVTDVTVVVNTFNFTRYKQSNDGRELQPVIDGINAAIGQKLNVRLNVGIKEGFNDDEVLDFLQLTFQHKYDIVFLPTISYDFLKSKMPALRQIEGDFGEIDMYKYPGSLGRIGFFKELGAEFMHEKLYSMKKELAELLKNDRLLKFAVKEVNKLDIIKGSLIVRNSNHENVAVDKILDGELQKDIPVKDYVFIENFCELIKVADNCLEMGNYIDKNFLISAYKILSENKDGYFRKSNPVLYAFNHVPVHSLDIEEKLDDAMRRVYSPEAGNNTILKGMYIHNRLIDIYPFEEYSAEIAIFAMNYYFMENGLTPINMPIARDAYFTMVGECLKGKKQEEFYNFLCRAMFDKMEGTIDACKEYIKKNI